MIDGSKRGLMQVKDVRSFLNSVLDEDIHTKRVASLANATLGVMTGASLGVAVIGKSLAQARGLLPKHAVKQVDRLLSNPRIEAVFASWVPEMVGPRTDIVVAMDWTDFDADGHLALHLVRNPGMVPNETICGVRRFHRVVFQRCVRCPPILHESFKKLE